MRGECFLRLGKPAEAAAEFDRQIQLVRELDRVPDGLSMNYRGLARAQIGRIQEALKDFDAALALREDIPEIWNNRGFCRFNLNDPMGAIEDYRAGLELCRQRGLLYSPSGESAWLFLTKLGDVYLEAAKALRATGKEEAARDAERSSARSREEAARLVPARSTDSR